MMATGIPSTQRNTGNDTPQSNLLSSTITLDYVGKSTVEEILLAQPCEIASLKCEGQPHSRLYYGDNLPILATLLADPLVKGRVKLIYIDPPYATNSVFQSRSQVHAYQDTLTGPAYIEFVRQRLILLKELLSDDGSIYIHLDETMAFYMKVIMDEVFGSQNFRNWITRKKCNPKNYTKHTYGDVSDYILFYTKSDTYTWNRPFEDWIQERAQKEYPYTDEQGRRYKRVPIHAAGTRNGSTGQPWRGMFPPPGKHWQYTPDKLDEMDKRGEIHWSSNGNPRRKIYLENSQGIPVQDIWLDVRDVYNQNTHITGYPTEKNPYLLERIIGASSNENDLVLDCFAGSGTTLTVASQLNRRWIGIDNSIESIRTILHRFRNGKERMGDFSDHFGFTKRDNKPTNLTFFDNEDDKKDVNKANHIQKVTDFEILAEANSHIAIQNIISGFTNDL